MQWFTLYSSCIFTCFNVLKGRKKSKKSYNSKSNNKERRKQQQQQPNQTNGWQTRRKMHLPFSFVYLLFLSSVTWAVFPFMCALEQLSMTWLPHESVWISYMFGRNDLRCVVKIAQTFVHNHRGKLHSKYSKCFPFFGVHSLLSLCTFVCAPRILMHAPKSNTSPSHIIVPILALFVVMLSVWLQIAIGWPIHRLNAIAIECAIH